MESILIIKSVGPMNDSFDFVVVKYLDYDIGLIFLLMCILKTIYGTLCLIVLAQTCIPKS